MLAGKNDVLVILYHNYDKQNEAVDSINQLENLKKEMLDTALEKFRAGLVYLDMEPDDIFYSINYEGIGQVYMKTNVYDSALYYARKALRSAETGPFFNELLSASNFPLRAFSHNAIIAS